MDRRFVASVLLVSCLAILIRFVKPEQALPDEDPPMTEWPSLDAIRLYDFYKISMRWPKSVCGNAAGCFPFPYFTIHGLWPQYTPDTEVPPYNASNPCTDVQPASETTITAKSLAPILKNMNYHWPSLTSRSISHKIEFWRHEWSKHGKCWDKPKQPLAYLRKALNFAIQNSLLVILRRAHIVPDETKTYNRNDIANAIKNVLGKIPEINCNNRNELTEIRVCYNRDNRRTDCPTHFSGCTSPKLAFPKPKEMPIH